MFSNLTYLVLPLYLAKEESQKTRSVYPPKDLGAIPPIDRGLGDGSTRVQGWDLGRNPLELIVLKLSYLRNYGLYILLKLVKSTRNK